MTIDVMVDKRLTKLEEALVCPGKPKSHIGEFCAHFANVIIRVEKLEEKMESFKERMN